MRPRLQRNLRDARHRSGTGGGRSGRARGPRSFVQARSRLRGREGSRREHALNSRRAIGCSFLGALRPTDPPERPTPVGDPSTCPSGPSTPLARDGRLSFLRCPFPSARAKRSSSTTARSRPASSSASTARSRRRRATAPRRASRGRTRGTTRSSGSARTSSPLATAKPRRCAGARSRFSATTDRGAAGPPTTCPSTRLGGGRATVHPGSWFRTSALHRAARERGVGEAHKRYAWRETNHETRETPDRTCTVDRDQPSRRPPSRATYYTSRCMHHDPTMPKRSLNTPPRSSSVSSPAEALGRRPRSLRARRGGARERLVAAPAAHAARRRRRSADERLSGERRRVIVFVPALGVGGTVKLLETRGRAEAFLDHT